MAPEDLPILAGTTPKPGFLDSHEPRNHTGEKREGRGERGEEKGTAGTHNFYRVPAVPFSSPLSPLPSLFSPVWFLGSWESKKPGFGVVPAKMGKSSGATFSKIQVDNASNCCQMAKNDRILADERPLEHFLAILAHFMPIYTRIFENGTARLRCPSGVSRALFCRSETISKVGNIKIMSASSPFFFSPLSPPFSFLSRVVSRLMGVQKTRFRCRSGQNGQIFRSHLFKNPGRYCKQLLSDGKK